MRKILLLHFLVFLVQLPFYGQENSNEYELRKQMFNLDTVNLKILKGENGTEIYYVREDFELGNNENITLVLIENVKSTRLIYINIVGDKQKIRLKNNSWIPLRVPNPSKLKNEIYYSELDSNNGFNWIKRPLHTGIMQFNQEWNIDELRVIKRDSLVYYKQPDIDGKVYDPEIYNIMIDSLGWYKIEYQK